MIPQYRAAILSGVMGAAFLVGGLALGASGSVDCDGHDMQQGDICMVTQKDGTVSRQTYDDRRSQQQITGFALCGGLGVLLLGFGGVYVAAGGRRGREQAAAAQATRELMSIPLPPEPAAPPSALPSALPADVVQAAYGARLGGYVQSMQPGKRSRALALWGLLLALGLFFLAIGAGNGAVGLIIGGIISLLAGIGFVWTLVSSPLVSAKARQLGFHLFTEGFVRATGAGAQAYRWDQISTIYQSIVRTRYNGISTGTQYFYLIDFADGRFLKLSNFSADMAVLGPILQRQVTRVQVPRAMQYLRSGRPIPFGAYTVNSAGVTRGDNLAAWSEIGGIKIENGVLKLCRPDGRRILGSRKIADLPNFLTFATLVEAMAGTRVPA